MQTPQTNQTIKQFTPKTKFLIFVKTGLLQYNTTNKGSRPEIQDDPGERGRGRRESTIFNTTNKGLCSVERRSSDEIFSAERRDRRKNETVGVKRKNDSESWIKGQCLSTQVIKTPGKRMEGNGRPG